MTKYAGNGQFSIGRLSLFYDAGGSEKEIDMKSAYVQIDLYESIFEHTMSGTVAIVDAFNLQDLLPLYGNERIEIEFFTQGNEGNPVSYIGAVYKVSEKHRVSEHSSGYRIHFISHEALNSQRVNVNRSYEETPSHIVSQLYKRIIGPSQKGYNALSTRAVAPYTFGTIKPLQAVSVLSKHSVSTNNDYGYLFYEDNKQFNFMPLQALYQQDPVREYRSRPAGMSDDEQQRVQEAHGTVQDIKVMEENSYLDRIMEGQHGTTSHRFDLFSKQLETYEYDKQSEFRKSKSLGANAYKKDIEASYEDRVAIRYDNNPTVQLPTIAKGIQQKVEINTIRVEITVFGDSIMRCGTCVDAYLPIWNKDQDQVTDMLTGKFLVSEIHHQLNNEEKYLQTIMLQKDAYENL